MSPRSVSSSCRPCFSVSCCRAVRFASSSTCARRPCSISSPACFFASSSACTESPLKLWCRTSAFWWSWERFRSLTASASILASASLTAPCSARSRKSIASNAFFSSATRSRDARKPSTSARPSFSNRADSRAMSSRAFVTPSTVALVCWTSVSMPADGLLAAVGLLRAFVQPVDLDVHVPDHFVQSLGFDDGPFHRRLLALEGLGLL